MSDVVWNVDGQGGDLRLYWFHWGLWSLALHFLPTGQRCECDLDVCTGEPECAPVKVKNKRQEAGVNENSILKGKSNLNVPNNTT